MCRTSARTGDGKSDDSAALQAAIDKAAATRLGGTVFIPAGRYRLTRTVFVWDAVRLIGYGATRPVFVLADNTPGFQKGVADMVLFSNDGPSALKPGASPPRCRRKVRCRPIPISPTPIRALSIPRCSILISRSGRAIRRPSSCASSRQHGVLIT